MTIFYPPILAAIKSANMLELRRQFEALPLTDLPEAGTFVGPKRLRASVEQFPGYKSDSKVCLMPAHARLADRPPPRPTPPTPADFGTTPLLSPATTPPQDASATTADILCEVSLQAFQQPIARTQAPPIQMPGLAHSLVAATLPGVEMRRTRGPLLSIAVDATQSLPVANSTPAPLNDLDYAASAVRNNVSIPAIKAVAIVESGGLSGFDRSGRPKILFEAHHFGPLTGNKFNKTHPHLACVNTAAARKEARKYYSWDQYERLHEALVLDPIAALKSASWGKFQVLGEAHDGWPDVTSFVNAMYVSEANHLRAFEAHCNAGGLFGALRKKQWLVFAMGYNGPKQQGYEGKIAAAYEAAGGK